MNTRPPKTSPFGLLLLAVALAVGAGRSMAAEIKAGDTFPPFDKFRLEGTLPDTLKDKVVLVDFWASWCVPCKQSFPALNELQKRYANQGFVIVGVSVDEKRALMDKFLKKTPASFTIVRDAEQKLVAATGVTSMPTSFLLDREGRVRFVHSGYKEEETPKQYVKEIEELLKKKSP